MTEDVDEEIEAVAKANDNRDQSKKTEVIDILFDKLIGNDTWPVERKLIVDSDLLVEAINMRNNRNEAKGEKLSTKNPANFLKDFIRKPSCNTNWPRRLTEMQVTARQIYGNEQVFEFVPFVHGDQIPFPDRFEPTPDLNVIQFESLTIPAEARKLGRQDESWLVQIAVSQRLIETHLAVCAIQKKLVVDSLAHLQFSIKTQPEIDAAFIASLDVGGVKKRAYVTVEAKQSGERILEHQIREQVKIAFALTKPLSEQDEINFVVPVVLKVVPNPNDTTKNNRLIYVAQFAPFEREKFEKEYEAALHDMPLAIQSAGLYEPLPPISGISWNPTRKRNLGKKTP